MTQPPAPTPRGAGALRRLGPADVPALATEDVPTWVRDVDAEVYAVEDHAETVGFVALRVLEHRDATAELAWQLDPEARGRGLAGEALRALVEHGFADLGLRRVEAFVDRRNYFALRVAQAAGLRIEGSLRGYRDGADIAVLGRLVSDPAPRSRDSFTAWLNSSLPTKRAIAQALVRDESGRMLVCELVYKKPWDLPGGVVDPQESPATAVLRELREELQVTARIRSLAAVSWLPAWRGWDDATLFVFEVDVPAQELAAIHLQPRELRAVHWCDPTELAEHAADYTVRVARQALAALDAGTGTVYLEDGRPLAW